MTNAEKPHLAPVHVMLDLETLGGTPNAAIIQVGAQAFRLDPPELFGPVFCRNVDFETANFGEIDPDTVRWWLRQSDAARNSVTAPGASLSSVLVDFRSWLQSARTPRPNELAEIGGLWSHPVGFDVPIFRAAHARTHTPWPFKQFALRCFGSVFKTVGRAVDRVEPDVKHDAGSDAKAQALTLLNIVRRLTSEGVA